MNINKTPNSWKRREEIVLVRKKEETYLVLFVHRLVLLVLFLLSFILSGFAQEQKSVTVYFGFNLSELSAAQRPVLEKLLTSKDSVKIISLKGFTDPIGSTSYNEQLAVQRIEAVQLFLSERNLKSEKTEVFGERYNANASDNDSLKRKVEIEYLIIQRPEKIEVKAPVKVEEVKPIPPASKFENLLANKEDLSVDLDVKFYGGTPNLLPSSIDELTNFLNFLLEHKEIKILIRGHVCCMDDYTLSIDRAKAIQYFLVENGVEATRLKTKGFSNKMPKVSPELTETDRQQNRRVDVVLIK